MQSNSVMKTNRAGLKAIRQQFKACGSSRDDVFALCREQPGGKKTMAEFATEYSYSQHKKRTRKSKSSGNPDLIVKRIMQPETPLDVVFDTTAREYVLGVHHKVYALAHDVTQPDNQTVFWAPKSTRVEIPLSLKVEKDLFEPEIRLKLRDTDVASHPVWDPTSAWEAVILLNETSTS